MEKKYDNYKSPDYWTQEEIHNLVVDTIGVDEVFPRGYQVLIKLFEPKEVDSLGILRADRDIKEVVIGTMMGQILRMGRDAFDDKVRFPGGPTVTYGEWAIFRGSERQRIRLNGKDMAFVNDDRFLAVTTNPEGLETTFDLIHEFIGS